MNNAETLETDVDADTDEKETVTNEEKSNDTNDISVNSREPSLNNSMDYNLSRCKFSQLQEMMKNTSDEELLKACKIEFFNRLEAYDDWMEKLSHVHLNDEQEEESGLSGACVESIAPEPLKKLSHIHLNDKHEEESGASGECHGSTIPVPLLLVSRPDTSSKINGFPNIPKEVIILNKKSSGELYQNAD